MRQQTFNNKSPKFEYIIFSYGVYVASIVSKVITKFAHHSFGMNKVLGKHEMNIPNCIADEQIDDAHRSVTFSSNLMKYKQVHNHGAPKGAYHSQQFAAEAAEKKGL